MVYPMKVYVMSDVLSGKIILDHILPFVEISGVLSLEEDQNVSGYFSFKEYCQYHNLTYVPIRKMDLQDEADKQAILQHSIDILLVLGWQRILPAWLLRHVKICTIGTHGTPRAFEKGRGNSPINWSIILQEKSFWPALFRMNAQVDSGDIIARKKINIQKTDSVDILYYKYSVALAEMTVDCIRLQTYQYARKQRKRGIYYPKRIAEDGAIDWSQNAEDICALIRGVTHPYPGAYSNLNGKKIIIYAAIPVRAPSGLLRDCPFGTVYSLSNMYGSPFVVKCKNALLYVTEYEGDTEDIVKPFDRLQPVVFTSVMQRETYQRIIKRHRIKHPNFTCNKKIMKRSW